MFSPEDIDIAQIIKIAVFKTLRSQKSLMYYVMAEVFQERPCPNECDGHGKCEDGYCNCIHNYIGNDCSTPSTTLNIDKIIAKDIPLGQSEFFHIRYTQSYDEPIINILLLENDTNLDKV